MRGAERYLYCWWL